MGDIMAEGGTIEDVAVSIDGSETVSGTLRVSRHVAERGPEPPRRADLRWRAVDAHGHPHMYDDDGRLPTLTMRSAGPCTRCPLSQPCRCRTLWYVCRICGEEVEPATVPDPHPADSRAVLLWQVDVLARDGFTYPGEKVIIEALSEGRRYFGIAEQTGMRTSDRAGYSVLTLTGCSDLGRLSTRVLAVVAS